MLSITSWKLEELEKYIRKVKRWNDSEMKSRWVAVALLEVENKMRRVNNYDKLPLLRSAIKSELNIKEQMVA